MYDADVFEVEPQSLLMTWVSEPRYNTELLPFEVNFWSKALVLLPFFSTTGDIM